MEVPFFSSNMRKKKGFREKVGMEVPFFSSDSLKWAETYIPRSGVSTPGSPCVLPPKDDYSSSFVIGTPPSYLICRIGTRQPTAIEILEVCADREIPSVGLRIHFPEGLYPFAHIYENKKKSSYGSAYLLYTFCNSATAYVIQLKNITAYASSYVFSSYEFLHFDTKLCPQCPEVTAVTATNGCLVVGRNYGSVACFQLGDCDVNAPGFMHELRDDAGLSNLWGLIARSECSCMSKIVRPVLDLVISVIHDRKVLFVLHSRGILRVWDLQSRRKLLREHLPTSGVVEILLYMWVESVDAYEIRVAVFGTSIVTDYVCGICIFTINCPSQERYSLLCEPDTWFFPLPKGKLIDVKFSSNKLWILREDGLFENDLNGYMENARCFSLQEAFVAEQLFQSSENSSFDDLYKTTCSMFSSSKAQTIGVISSIFLRRLLHPGVHNSSAYRSTLQVYGKHLTDSEFQALTADGLRREILLLIEHLYEAMNGNLLFIFNCWKEFCSQYFGQWCQFSAPLGLLYDSSSGVVGLIRQNGVSLFRSFEDIELVMNGTFDFWKYEFDGLEREILYEVLCCTKSLYQRLGGQTISPFFYESVVGAPLMSVEDIVPLLLKTMECGYNYNNTCLGALHVSQVADDKSLRKFAVNTLMSLNALCKKANGWGKVLDITLSYLKFLEPPKPKPTDCHKYLDSDVVFHCNMSVIVHATSQVAGLMLESALGILLFLTYLVDFSGQVYMLPDNVSRIQLELIPMVHKIIVEWIIIHLFSTMPSESISKEDFSSQLSSPRIESSSRTRSWTRRIGSIDFPLTFILLFDAHDSSRGWNNQSLSSLPNPGSITNLVQHFSTWLIWGRSVDNPLYVSGHTTELALRLLRHGQYNAVENLLMIVDTHSWNEKLFGQQDI